MMVRQSEFINKNLHRIGLLVHSHHLVAELQNLEEVLLRTLEYSGPTMNLALVHH